jgi:hypothetical protein
VGKFRLPLRAWIRGIPLAILWGAPFIFLVGTGLRLTSPTLASSIAPALMPDFAGAMSWLAFGGEAPSAAILRLRADCGGACCACCDVRIPDGPSGFARAFVPRCRGGDVGGIYAPTARKRSVATPGDAVRPSECNNLPGQVVLVFQGGGALGSYQAGVYQALHEADIEPDWIIGTSIGAINARSLRSSPSTGSSEDLGKLTETAARPPTHWPDLTAQKWSRRERRQPQTKSRSRPRGSIPRSEGRGGSHRARSCNRHGVSNPVP